MKTNILLNRAKKVLFSKKQRWCVWADFFFVLMLADLLQTVAQGAISDTADMSSSSLLTAGFYTQLFIYPVETSHSLYQRQS